MLTGDLQPSESEPSRWRPWLRKRVPLLLIVVGLLLIGPRLIKREVELHFVLPTGAERLRLKVLRDEAVCRGIEVQLAGDESHRETLSLTPGSYRIEATLWLQGATRRAEKSVELPEDSPVEIGF